ncbi:MAG: hypothetical protein JAY96_21120, partial [Candidatus Thiodiazotropha endolucinida]|nr:hypothetical protein [Candidatus Thiodiazotropha taylori]MCW4250698.1 hypothetical protein [Candidatus Thiodiazotropha endolucinida]
MFPRLPCFLCKESAIYCWCVAGTPDYTLLESMSVGLNIQIANCSGVCCASFLFDVFGVCNFRFYFIHYVCLY